MPGNCAPHSEGKSACFHPGGGQKKVDYNALYSAFKTLSQVAPTGPAFSQCTACSPPVLEALDSQGWELIKKVGEKPSHLEDLTGLTALMQVCNNTFKYAFQQMLNWKLLKYFNRFNHLY